MEVGEANDLYLKYHHNSPEALAHANAVLTAFSFFVQLATDRAVEALYVPVNVVPLAPRVVFQEPDASPGWDLAPGTIAPVVPLKSPPTPRG